MTDRHYTQTGNIDRQDDTQWGILTTWPSNYFKGHYITLNKYYYTERQATVKYVCHGNGRWKKKKDTKIYCFQFGKIQLDCWEMKINS